ncbi:hypothetical protein FACS189413_13880 [Bacteroidia bacterium]|nr:hypothetical protein FACS189413_13880 [Bacteroidia bacterium]
MIQIKYCPDADDNGFLYAIGLFSFIAMNKMLDIAVNILLVLWIIVGYKCFYDRNRKPVKS